MAAFPNPIVIVYWDDAVQHRDGSVEPIHRAARQVTIGWMLRHNAKGITIVSEYSDQDGSWRDETFIPGGMIVDIEELVLE